MFWGPRTSRVAENEGPLKINRHMPKAGDHIVTPGTNLHVSSVWGPFGTDDSKTTRSYNGGLPFVFL